MSATERDLRKLARLLDEERAALRCGDMERISQVGSRKLTVVERLEGVATGLPRQSVPLGERIVQGLRRNQQLIASAMDGVRDAQELLARARLPRTHETYARDGMRQKIDPAPGRLEKRA